MPTAYLIGSVVGALIATYLISRLWLWLTGRLVKIEPTRIVVAYGAAWITCVGLAAFGFGEPGRPAWSQGLLLYTPPLAVWLVIDLLARRSRAANPDRP